ncbi:MAG TPA: hypothetical protein VG939_21175 [Caulobacteraceae bacterium]|nr:hypothetical protein [Caulobacteraceae bacterium]
MRHNPAWAGQAAWTSEQRGAKSIGALLFVVLLGCAFWAGAIWASLPLLN